LGEVCEKIGDGLHGTPKYSEDGEYFFINGNNIVNGKIEIKQDTKKIDQIEFDKYKKDLNERTVLLSINGTIGNLAKYRNEKCILGKSAAYFNIKNDVSVDFVYYLMFENRFQYDISKNANGSTIKNVGLAQLRNYSFLLPPLPEQKAIASVLSSFDDKIELLREQNKTLEEMGQTIFKEWFLPSRQAGGKYGVDDLLAEDSAQAGDLPEGWRVGKLGEVGQIVCGKTPSKENKEYFGGEIPFIKIPDMHGEVFIVKTEDSLTELGANTQKNKFIPKNAICVSCIATVGLVTITSKDSQTNQQINSIVPNDGKYLEYLYFALTNMKSDLLAIGSGGSATLNINTSTFSNIEIMLPNQEVLENFHNTTNSIFTKILDNLHEIQSLARSRDELLPKLMSGAVRVNGFE
jgi:type I restriction enzyme S subunit